MGNTITGAASGETAFHAAPKDSQSQAKGQKSNHYILFVCYSYVLFKDWRDPIFLFLIFYEVKKMSQRRAVVSVIGKDQVGIIAKVTTILSENHINILDISQTILQDFFTMMMLVDVSNTENLDHLQKQFNEIGEELNLKINIQLEEIFKAMHRV